MTDQQIESAARKLCELRGEDPDGNWTPKILNWQMAAIRLEAFYNVRENKMYVDAINFGKARQ